MEKSTKTAVVVLLFLAVVPMFASAISDGNSKEIAVEQYLSSYSGDVTSSEFQTMCYDREKTLIAGKIFMADTNKSVSKAHITVECEHNGKFVTKNTTSDKFGRYSVIFNKNKNDVCTDGDTVTVSAQKDSMTGLESGVVEEGRGIFKKFDVAFISVPLIPEFGMIAGIVTIMGAIIAFLLIRK